jgi:hypothetical protein
MAAQLLKQKVFFPRNTTKWAFNWALRIQSNGHLVVSLRHNQVPTYPIVKDTNEWAPNC